MIWETGPQRQHDALALYSAHHIPQALAMFQQLSAEWEAAMEHAYPLIRVDLDAAEMAVNALTMVVTCQLAIVGADGWSDDQASALRQTVDRLLAVGKLIKKRYEMKVLTLTYAAEALYYLNEGTESAKHRHPTKECRFLPTNMHKPWRLHVRLLTGRITLAMLTAQLR